ncbi:MAG: hypothetical protein IT426_08375 [Pirellulales bacterium]|nr:hypothetical protein [Pirellulales bacterium]
MATTSFAQVEPPAAEPPAAGVEAPKPDATKTPAGKPAAEAGDEAFGKSDVLPSDPAVAALLAANPATPGEWAKTAKILVDLRQPAMAKQFLKKIVDAKLDGPRLAALGRELGAGAFLKFTQDEALQPFGKQLGDAVLAALNAEFQKSEKIAAALKLLQDPSIEKRTEALHDLQAAGKPAVAALIEVLADPVREAEYKYVRAALAMMGRRASTPLIGIMQSANSKLNEQAIIVLGDAVAIDAKFFLLAPAVPQAEGGGKESAITAAAQYALKRLTGGKILTKSEAIKLLSMAANLYLNRQPALPDAADGKVEIWRWDDKQHQCEIASLPVEDARLAAAARMAHDALALEPENREAGLIYWTATLELDAYQNGLDKSPSKERRTPLLESGNLNKCQELLEYAISTKHYPAATALATAMGQSGKADALLYPTSGQSILVKAVQQPDRRLRMAALQAIAKLKPEKPYPGSSSVTQALAFFAAGTGTRKALVAGPNLNNIPRLVSGLSAAGFSVDTANTGKEVMQKLLASPDYEIAMIDAGISLPSIDLLLQQIRRDDRSADVRLGLIARAGFFDRAEHVAKSDPLTMDFPRPNDDAAVKWEVEQLASIKPRDLVRPEERLREAGEALDLLAEFGRSPKLYDVRQIQEPVIAALKIPALAAKALAVLANVNSPESQRAMLDVANRDTSPVELRLAAVDAFRANVEKHGVLLTTAEIRRQYELYNKSEKADKAVQKVFGLILDCLEARSGKK